MIRVLNDYLEKIPRDYRDGQHYNDETAALAEAERVVKNLAASEGAATALNSEDAIYLMECRRKLILPRKSVRGFVKERPENGKNTKQVCAAI